MKTDDLLKQAPHLAPWRPKIGCATPASIWGTYGKEFEQDLADAEIELLRPARKNEDERPGAHLFTPLRRPSSRSKRSLVAYDH